MYVLCRRVSKYIHTVHSITREGKFANLVNHNNFIPNQIHLLQLCLTVCVHMYIHTVTGIIIQVHLYSTCKARKAQPTRKAAVLLTRLNRYPDNLRLEEDICIYM